MLDQREQATHLLKSMEMAVSTFNKGDFRSVMFVRLCLVCTCVVEKVMVCVHGCCCVLCFIRIQ